MTTTEGYDSRILTFTARDDTTLRYRLIQCNTGRLRDHVFFLPGTQSHSGWYFETVARLIEHAFRDYRGSGLHPHFRGCFRNRSQLLGGLGRLMAVSQRDTSGVPNFIIGFTWVAELALVYALSVSTSLAGVFCISPCLRAHFELTRIQRLRLRWAQVIFPWHRTSLSLTTDTVTSNPNFIPYIDDDSLSLRHVSARLLFESFGWVRQLAKQDLLEQPRSIIMAVLDPIVDTAAVRSWYVQVTAPWKRVLPTLTGQIINIKVRRERH